MLLQEVLIETCLIQVNCCLKIKNNFDIVQRKTSSVNDHINMLNLATAKGTDVSLKTKEQLFNSNIDKSVFDSLHSYSKFSSLGGTHSIEKKRRKIKGNVATIKKNSSKTRTKPGSSKKSDKTRIPSAQLGDKVVIQNYRSANFTSKPMKMAINQENISQQRYQYHKRIRSDTGNTIMNPLEQVQMKNQISNGKNITNPSFHHPKTDLSTPLVKNKVKHFEGDEQNLKLR